MYYTIKIDSDIVKKCGLIGALVYAHLLIVGADTPLKDLAVDLPFLTYRQIRHGRSRLEAAGLIEECCTLHSQNEENDKYVKLTNMSNNFDKNVKLTKMSNQRDKYVKSKKASKRRHITRARARVTKLSNNKLLPMRNYYKHNLSESHYILLGDKIEGCRGKEKDLFGMENKPITECEQSVTPSVTAPETEPIKENKDEDSDELKKVKEIIEYFNVLTHSRYTHKNKDIRSHIHARLVEGATVEDFKTVIKRKLEQWQSDPQMCRYITPSTLFRSSHFWSYLNEIEPTKKPAKPKSTESSFDSDEFMAAALKRSYSEGGDGT